VRNPLVEAAADVANAINALRLKRHRLVPTSTGVEIHQPGRPILTLTYEHARRFAHDLAEAEAS